MDKNTKTLRKPSLAIIFSSDFESWPTGGMLSFVLEIIPWLREHFQIELWGAKVDNRVPKKFVEIEGEKFPIYYFYQAKTKRKLIPNFLKAMIGIRKFKKKLLSNKYDILYFHGEPLVIAYGKSPTKKPLIVLHQHGTFNPDNVPVFLYRAMQKISIKLSDLCFVSALEEDFYNYLRNLKLEKKDREKVVRINNFVDERLFNANVKSPSKINNKRQTYKFLWVGRLVKVKDPELAIKAFSNYINQFSSNASLLIAGDGPLLKKCEKLVDDLGLEDKVMFLGSIPRKEVASLMKNSDLLLFTSRKEGIPLTIIEAFMCGLPVVACDSRGVSGLVKHNVNGYIVKQREPLSYAKGIESALQSLKQLRENLIKEKDNFTAEKIANSIIDKILEIFYATVK
jgi:glycosyltransferase EpsD